MAYLNSTLCWHCVNAVPNAERGCSWSRKLIPVEGWRATRKPMKYDLKMVESFIVHWCPEYVREKERESNDFCYPKLG